MNECQLDTPCIEREGFLQEIYRYSVAEYEASMRRAECFSNTKALSFHRLIWTQDAPKVEDLSSDWLKTSEGRFRIFKPIVYHVQMRRFVGLA